MSNLGTPGGQLEWTKSFDLRTLLIYVTACETGSMASAGERLGITQSAVSQSINRLEEGLDVQLIDRSARPFRLTVSGIELRKRAQELLLIARNTRQTIQNIGSGLQPELRIGLICTLMSAVMPKFYDQLRNVKMIKHIHFQSGQSQDHYRALMHREIDLIFSPEAYDFGDGFQKIEIFRDPFIVIRPRQNNSKPGLDGLIGKIPYVGLSPETTSGRMIKTHFQRMRIDVEDIVAFDTEDLILKLVSDGSGWTVVPLLTILNNQFDLSKVQVELFPKNPFSRTLALFYRSGELGDLPPEIAKIVVGRMKEVLSEHQEGIGRDVCSNFKFLLK